VGKWLGEEKSSLVVLSEDYQSRKMSMKREMMMRRTKRMNTVVESHHQRSIAYGQNDVNKLVKLNSMLLVQTSLLVSAQNARKPAHSGTLRISI
jgi:ribosomal protein L7Ae-like RNA K-turn-binding protein